MDEDTRFLIALGVNSGSEVEDIKRAFQAAEGQQ